MFALLKRSCKPEWEMRMLSENDNVKWKYWLMAFFVLSLRFEYLFISDRYSWIVFSLCFVLHSSDVFQRNWSSVVTVYGIKSVPDVTDGLWLMVYNVRFMILIMLAQRWKENLFTWIASWENENWNSNQRWNGCEIFKFQIVTGQFWCINGD